MTGNEEVEVNSITCATVELSDPESEKLNTLDFSDDQSCEELVLPKSENNSNDVHNSKSDIEHDIKIIDLENNPKDLNCDSEDVNKTKISANDSIDIFQSNISNDIRNEEKESNDSLHISRIKPIMHPPSEKPLCQKHLNCPDESVKMDCNECFDMLLQPSTSMSQIFAAMREWMPGNQKKMNVLVEEMMRKGAHVDDMDGLEGNTMLHYACKSASEGVGSSEMAQLLVKHLLGQGANYKLRARWTDMLPLHFAAYFNCPEILKVLLDASGNTDIDARCKEYDQGTALHMAASGLCYNAAEVLFDRGADPTLINNKFKTPFECIADGTRQELRQTPECLDKLSSLLENAKSPVAEKVLQEIGLSLGDTVLVGGEKSGTLKFCGKTDFASGVWCGVELHDKVGKNNGSVAGVTYFRCKPEHGMFAPPSKLSTLDIPRSSSLSGGSDSHKLKLQVGERVNVVGCKFGFVRFVGKVKFSGGIWVGVELDKPYGKCNGTMDGVKYFACKPQHGVLVPVDKVKRVEVYNDSKIDGLLSPKVNRPTGRSVASPGNFDSNRTPVCASPMRGTTRTYGTPSSPTLQTPPALASTSLVTSPPNSATSSVAMTSPVASRGNTSRGTGSSSGGVVRSTSGSSGVRGTSPNRTSANNANTTENVYKKQIKMHPGMNAFVNGELGTVKFVGRVDFADGIWIGVHLKNPTGKNDGMVQGKRYFLCKPGYGIMVKPSKVTIHGITASKLIDETDYPE